MHIHIDKYEIEVKHTNWEKNKQQLSDKIEEFLQRCPTIDENCNMEATDIRAEEIYCHNAQLCLRTKTVPVEIISPIVAISWLYMLPAWRNLLDFNFKRHDNWNDDTPVLRFNECEYVQKHQIWDWHSFAMLKNDTLIHNGLFVEHGTDEIVFVIDIVYHIKDKFLYATHKRVFTRSNDQEDWKPDAVLQCRKLKKVNNIYVLQQNVTEYIIDADSDLQIIEPSDINYPIFDYNGDTFVIKNKTQHVDVQQNKPFFFITLGFDKYHHTRYTGRHDWDTHGVYWWVANMNPAVQFTKQLTMTMGQIPDCIKRTTIGQLTYKHWQPIMQNGITLWNGYAWDTVYGMIANQITDMDDRDHYMRKRKNNIKSFSDGMLWAGYQYGCKWPDNVSNLMQLGIILPGPYLLKIWKHVKHTLSGPNGLWHKFNDKYAKCITMTTSDEDIYGELPIASTLKSTIELNHTTVLGCTSDLLKIVWNQIHLKNNFEEAQTRFVMKLYLNKYFDGINGCCSMLADYKTKITVFNAMHHAWQKLIECLICLPTIVDWYANIGALVSLIRITGALYNVNTMNQIQNLQNIIKPVLQISLVL